MRADKAPGSHAASSRPLRSFAAGNSGNHGFGVHHSVILDAALAAAAALACVIFAAWIYRFNEVPLEVPLAYSGDALYYGALIKGVIENGWYLHNPSLGAPFGLDMGPFPMSDNTHFAMLWLIGLFTDEFGSALNVFYLTSFATAAISAFVSMRWMGLNRLFSLCGAILYSLQAYHFLRGGHLFLASYFCLPIFSAFAMGIFAATESSQLSTKSLLGYALLLAVAAGCGIYYALFASLLIGFAAIAGSVEHGCWRPMRLGLAAGLIILIATTASLAPHLQAIHDTTLDGNLTQRDAVETERYGLRMIQMALPTPFHQNDSFRKQADEYRSRAPNVTENRTASIGLIAFLGFMGSLIYVLQRFPAQDPTLRRLGVLNLIAFLFATIGGFASLFAWFATAQFRAPNRISILIAFLSLCFFLLILQNALKKIRRGTLRHAASFAAFLAILAFGTWDQSLAKSNLLKSNQVIYEHDRASADAIMHHLSPGSRVYQLPYVPFPEAAPLHAEGHTGLMRRFLHSKGIAWSYGSMKFSAVDQWIRRMELSPLRERLGKLAASDFDAVLVERRAYADNGKSVEAELQDYLGPPAMTCPDQSCSLFRLKAFSETEASPLLSTALGSGYSAWETANPGWRSATLKGSRASIQLLNPLKQTIVSRLNLDISTPAPIGLEIWRGGELLHSWNSHNPSSLDMTFELAPGINSLDLRFRGIDNDGMPIIAPAGIRLSKPVIGAVDTPLHLREFQKQVAEADRIFSPN